MIRVYIACSLDGFIAGPDDDLSWLQGADGRAEDAQQRDDGSVDYDEFMAEVGAILMGRRTYDVVCGFDVPWPYGDTPVLVATHRPLDPVAPSVRVVSGDIAHVVAEARRAAGGKHVYLDGGALIRQAMDAGLVDDLIITIAPVVLGEGHALFAGLTKRHPLEFTGHYRFGGAMVQLHARPVRTVTLRDVTDADVDLFYDHQIDDEGRHMVAFSRNEFKSRDYHRAHWVKIRALDSVETRTVLADGVVVGHVGKFMRDDEAEVTYWLGREHWGKGIATKALSLFLDVIEERPLCGRVVADNTGSLRVLQKCGFTIVGRATGFAEARGEEVEEIVLQLK